MLYFSFKIVQNKFLKMSDVCFICSKPAKGEIVVVKRGINILINSSVERNDGYVDYLKDRQSVTVHSLCRKVYTKKSNITATNSQRAIKEADAGTSTPHAKTRTIVESGDVIKEECSLLCCTCLSNGRVLSPLGGHKNIFQRLFNTQEVVDMCICWECHAILNKVAKFVNKANQAEIFLLNSVEKIKSLSSLKSINIHEFNDIHIKQEEESMVVKSEIDNCAENEINHVAFDDFDYTNQDEPSNDDFPDSKLDIHSDNINIDHVTFDDFDYTNQDEPSSDDFPDSKLDIQSENINIDTTKMTIKSDNTNNDSKTVTIALNESENKALNRNKAIEVEKKRTKRYLLNESTLYDYTESYRIIYLMPNQLPYWFEKDRTDCLYVQNEFKCEKCVLSWPEEKQLTEHMRRHSNVQNSTHICDVCSCNFQNKLSLLLHMRIHFHVYACQLCNDQFHKPKQMYDHFMQNHYNLFMCTKCPLSFGRYKDFTQHYKGMHMRFQCDYCQKTYPNKKSLAKHVSMIHLSKCPICNLVVKSYKNIQYHIDSKHKIVRDETTFCVECNKQFDTRTKFNLHIGYSQFHKKQKGIPISTYTCPICKKVYAFKAKMLQHMDFVHAKSTKFYCKECDKNFSKKANLLNHQRRHHEGIKPIKNKICHFCGRGFAVNRTLTNHIRTHTGERPFQCSYCPSSFAQKVARNYHERNVHLKTKKANSQS